MNCTPRGAWQVASTSHADLVAAAPGRLRRRRRGYMCLVEETVWRRSPPRQQRPLATHLPGHGVDPRWASGRPGVSRGHAKEQGTTVIRRLAICLTASLLAGCVSLRRPPDPQRTWRRTQRRRAGVAHCIRRIERQRHDYETVARLARDGDLRAQAFLRLAGLSVQTGDHERAREELRSALTAGPAPSTRREALLALGDVSERFPNGEDRAAAVYRQLLTEHPGTLEAELAGLRLEDLDHGR